MLGESAAGEGCVKAAVVVAWLVMATVPAVAFDPEETFKQNTVVVSVEAGGGKQQNLEGQETQTGLSFVNGGIRVSLLPLGTTGSEFLNGSLYGALEVGLEPFLQRYVDPVNRSFGGLGLAFRYHFLSLGRFVPYAEVFGAAGGTDLKVREIRSTFTFLLHGGVGGEVFLTDRTALYAGYRLQHVSNGNAESPNRGFESHTGVAGVSFFFP
jgi:hypothetical protein